MSSITLKNNVLGWVWYTPSVPTSENKGRQTAMVFLGGEGEVSQGYIVWEMLNLTQLKMLLYSRTLQGFSMLVDTLAGQSR